MCEASPRATLVEVAGPGAAALMIRDMNSTAWRKTGQSQLMKASIRRPVKEALHTNEGGWHEGAQALLLPTESSALKQSMACLFTGANAEAALLCCLSFFLFSALSLSLSLSLFFSLPPFLKAFLMHQFNILTVTTQSSLEPLLLLN